MSNLLYTNSQLMLERAMNFQWTKQVLYRIFPVIARHWSNLSSWILSNTSQNCQAIFWMREKDRGYSIVQVILEDDSYHMHHLLSEFGRKEEGAPC